METVNMLRAGLLVLATGVTVTQGDAVLAQAQVRVVDISSTVRCSEAGCQFSSELSRAFDNLTAVDEAVGTFRPRPVEIGGRTYQPQLSSEPGDELEGPETTFTVSFDDIILRWNGLRIIGLEAYDAHESSSTAVIFASSSSELRAKLASFGVALPAPPRYRELPTDGCSASLGVEERDNGSAFVHASWC